ncbi:hypothetical protein AJ79_05272 [Helicocarpus griseus UAMH5409]|uniref:RGS domain-containing protein n=1 Tax=Helicocarpus griseus UAMH5409 TaxID=1447875 RepID=A0A2B7XP89_9EURO|nr:hypothetical protein AJ79_05272 [Helicocarpus griseus UAMH5409]
MAFRLFKRCPVPEPPTRAPGAYEEDKRSRFARIPDVWRNRDGLSFDMVIGGCTCPPCTLRDFMNYLIYVERNAEYLQFFLWHRDYSRRFALIAESQRRLSPEWTGKEKPGPDVHVTQIANPNPRTPSLSPDAAAIADGTEPILPQFPPPVHTAPPSTPPQSPNDFDSEWQASPRTGMIDCDSSPRTERAQMEDSPNRTAERTDATRTREDEVRLRFIAQPFRKEISKIFATYIADGSSRQLNLTSQERDNLMRALAYTTHPSAFSQVAEAVEWVLRQQSHPNFIRWTLSNSNRHRLLVARVLSCTALFFGLVAGILPIFSSATRAWRALSALILLPGAIAFLSSWDGACILFLFLNRRQLHPWELFSDEDEHTLEKLGIVHKAFESIGETNSYEDEPWIPRYEKRNFFQKVFDPETHIQDPALRRIHFIVLLRTSVVATILTAVLVGIFLAMPKGNFF